MPDTAVRNNTYRRGDFVTWHKVLQQLRKAGLQANIRKSEFSVKWTKYLGFIISTDRIKVDLETTAIIN